MVATGEPLVRVKPKDLAAAGVGSDPDFSWIDLPVIEDGISSEQIHGVGRDAARIAGAIAARHGNSHRSPQVAERPDQLESA